MQASQNSFSQSSNFKIHLPFIGDDYVYAQNVNLPDFSLNPSLVNHAAKSAYIGGDHIEYSPITIGFILDENFDIYIKILKYILARIHQNSGIIEPLAEFTVGVELTDNKGESLLCFEFYGCKLNNLSSVSLISNADDAEQIFDITLYFDDWELIDYREQNKLKDAIIKS